MSGSLEQDPSAKRARRFARRRRRDPRKVKTRQEQPSRQRVTIAVRFVEALLDRLQNPIQPIRSHHRTVRDHPRAACPNRSVRSAHHLPTATLPLSHGKRLEPGTEAFGANVAVAELRAMLDRYPSTVQGQEVAQLRAG